MQIGILGINHKIAEVGLRERFARACESRFHPERAIHPHIRWVLLSTCNRTEIYFSSVDLAESHTYLLSILRQEMVDPDFEKKAYSFFGEECLAHLVKVTSGVDAACFLETEIQGQVKKAYLLAQSAHPLSSEIHFLFQKSLFLAKKVRSLFSAPKNQKLEELIWKNILAFSPNPSRLSILLVGASETNRKIAKALFSKGCRQLSLFSSRQLEPSDWMPELQLKIAKNKETWGTYDLLLFASKQKEFILRPEDTLLWKGKKLLIDVSVPRVVDPGVVDPDNAQNQNLTLRNIDEIHQRSSVALQAHEQELLHQKIKAFLVPIQNRHHRPLEDPSLVTEDHPGREVS